MTYYLVRWVENGRLQTQDVDTREEAEEMATDLKRRGNVAPGIEVLRMSY